MPTGRNPGEAPTPRPVIVKCSLCGLDRQGFDVVHGPTPGLFICRDCVQLCLDILGGSDQLGPAQAAE